MAVTRVLLVDDESLVRRTSNKSCQPTKIWKWLARQPMAKKPCPPWRGFKPDIVIMDIRMPGLDGIAAAREIRDKYPQVKVIGLSEYAYGYNNDAMEKAGAVGVYQKSMALEQLYPAIKKFAPAHPTV